MAEGSKTAKDARLQARQERLAAELRANLAKRKAQARAKAAVSVAYKHRDGEHSGRP